MKRSFRVVRRRFTSSDVLDDLTLEDWKEKQSHDMMTEHLTVVRTSLYLVLGVKV